MDHFHIPNLFFWQAHTTTKITDEKARPLWSSLHQVVLKQRWIKHWNLAFRSTPTGISVEYKTRTTWFLAALGYRYKPFTTVSSADGRFPPEGWLNTSDAEVSWHGSMNDPFRSWASNLDGRMWWKECWGQRMSGKMAEKTQQSTCWTTTRSPARWQRRQQRSYGCCFWGWPPEEDGHAEQNRERILQWMLRQAGTTKELRMISHRTREDIVSQLKDTPFTNDADQQQEIFNAALYRLFEKTTFPV